MKDKKIHYGWIIVIACNILLAATIGIISNSSSLFIKPISDDLGVSRRAVSSTISLLAVGGMITSLFAGRIFNDHNIIAIMKVSVVILTVSFFANSFFHIYKRILDQIAYERILSLIYHHEVQMSYKSYYV